MKFKVNRRAFLKSVSRAAAAADAKSTMPILSHVLLEAVDGKAVVKATDLVVGVFTSVIADVETTGSVAAPAKMFLDRVKAMPDGDVEVSCGEGSQIAMRAVPGSRRYNLSGYPGGEFPSMDDASGAATVLPLETLRKLIISTQYAISGDTTRLHLSSALLAMDGKVARMVSTDGHRLSMIECAHESEHQFSLLIPAAGVSELKSLVESAIEAQETEVTLLVGSPRLFVKCGETTLSIKLTDAQFPPYQQVIPSTCPVQAVVSKQDLLAAAQAVMLSANERTGGIKFTIEQKKILVSAESPDAGVADDEISAETVGNSTVGINAKYLVDVLRAVDTKQVQVLCGGELDPVKLHQFPLDDSRTFTAVILPMRIS